MTRLVFCRERGRLPAETHAGRGGPEVAVEIAGLKTAGQVVVRRADVGVPFRRELPVDHRGESLLRTGAGVLRHPVAGASALLSRRSTRLSRPSSRSGSGSSTPHTTELVMGIWRRQRRVAGFRRGRMRRC
jgi:hypothetical protein